MSTTNYETIEQAREAILDLQGKVTELTNERDTLSQNNNQLTQELESVRKLNQKYFNQLSAQFQDQEDKKYDEEKEVPSCEDFARTLNII